MKLGRRARYILHQRRKNRDFYHFFRVKAPSYLTITQSRIGLHEAADFKRELMSYLTSYEGDICLDLSSLDSLDSSGIAVLVEAEAQELIKSHVLKLRNLRENPQQVIRLTMTDEIFMNPERYLSNRAQQASRSNYPR